MKHIETFNDLNTDFQVKWVGNKFKEFSAVNRGDYESMPCSMAACLFTDEQMQQLADEISIELQSAWADDDVSYECYEENFWETMETTAVRMGMRYYEDMSDEEYALMQGKVVLKNDEAKELLLNEIKQKPNLDYQTELENIANRIIQQITYNIKNLCVVVDETGNEVDFLTDDTKNEATKMCLNQLYESISQLLLEKY